MLLLSTLLFIQIINGQSVPSSCVAPDSIIKMYKTDADQMAIRRVYRTSSSFMDSVNIPKTWSDTILRALIAVYNATSLPARDTVITMANIHALHTPFFLNFFYLSADSNSTWMQQLRVGNLITGNDTIDQLISKYHLSMNHYSTHFNLYAYHTVTFYSDSNYNASVLASYFLPVHKVYYSETSGGGDGNNISDSIYSNYVELNYSLGWGDCPSGCTARRTWKFHVYDDCSVEYMGSFGQYPIPSNLISTIREYKNDINIYPNPFYDKIFFDLNSNECEFKIIDVCGKTIRSGTINEPYIANLSDVKSGLYILQLINKDNIITRKIIKD